MRALSAFLYMLFSTVQEFQYLTKCFAVEIVSYVGEPAHLYFYRLLPIICKSALVCKSFRGFMVCPLPLMVKER